MACLNLVYSTAKNQDAQVEKKSTKAPFSLDKNFWIYLFYSFQL